MDMIERDLRGILTLNRTRQDHLRVRNRVLVGIDGDSIDFVATTKSLVVRPDDDRFLQTFVNEVGYRLRPSPESDDFLEIYRREDLGVDEDPFDGGEFSFLTDRIKSFDIQIYEEDGPDAEPVDEWGQEGTEKIGLPARLEITMVVEPQRRLAQEATAQRIDFRRTVTHRRVIRLPEALRVEEGQIAVVAIPEAPAEAGPAVAPGGAATDAPAGHGQQSGGMKSGGSSGSGSGGGAQVITGG
jgi:hypothetical protein